VPTAIVSGALANKPGNDGNAWTRLSWVRGLQRLGWQVTFVEQIQSCSSEQLNYFRAMLQGYRACLLDENGRVLAGEPVGKVDLLFNISGHLRHARASCRVYYDDDPGYTQFWRDGARLEGHDHYFTIGANIGTPGCDIPPGDICWKYTRPPVTLEDWPVCAAAFDRFTTVASWRGAYARVRNYGQKAHEFRKFFELPQRSMHPFEIALNIDPGDQKDRDALLAHGWRLVDPPRDFRRYVQTSGAEFSVAQGIYVETNSGWFSDRTVRYLASGKPALVQETGFSQHVPAGEGLLSFRTLDEAVAGAESIVSDYDRHCRAARRIAEEYFGSDCVIRRLLEEIA